MGFSCIPGHSLLLHGGKASISACADRGEGVKSGRVLLALTYSPPGSSGGSLGCGIGHR